MAKQLLSAASPPPVLFVPGHAGGDAVLAELRARRLAAAAPGLMLALGDAWARVGCTDAASPRPCALRPAHEAPTGPATGLHGGAGSTGTALELARDCVELSAWLKERGALVSAVAFAEAAARLEPESAARALRVARLARELGRLPAAGAWGVRALRLAGRGLDPAARAAAFVELGHLSAARQRYAEARRFFSLARRFAASRRLPVQEGDATAGLALLQWGHRREREALELFAGAVHAYGAGSSAVADLGLLVARLWLDAGEHRGAALLGRVLLCRPTDPRYALPAAGVLARSAAALGWELMYESACQCALLALGQLAPEAPLAAALLDLTRAHVGRGLWARAELSADLASVHARATGDVEAARQGRRMLAAIARRKLSKRLRAELFPDRVPQSVPEGEEYPAGDPVQALVACFQAALRGGRARRPRRP